MRTVLQNIFVSLLLTAGCGFIGYLTALYLNKILPLTVTKINIIRAISITIIAWAVLGKVGWAIQTWSGNTFPEKVNNILFKVLYMIGLYLVIISIFLKSQ